MTDFPETPWDDTPAGWPVWHRAIPTGAALGAAVGAVLLGAAIWGVASGAWAIPYTGFVATAGAAPAAVAGAGVGAAAGGLLGGSLGVLRLRSAPRPLADVSGSVRIVVDGLIAGLIAAVAYWLLDHLIAWLAHGRPLAPSGMMASVLLGRDALHLGTRAPVEAVAWGWLGHLVVSLPWGVALALFARWRPRWLAAPDGAALWSLLFGVVVWIANVYVAAPLLGMPWFTEHDPMTMLLVHLAFGAGAGAWVHARLARSG